MSYTLKTLITVSIATFIIGLIIGICFGYSRNSKLSESLKPIQMIGVGLFIGYILLAKSTDSVIALGILALIPGEFIGKKVGGVIEKVVDKK